MKKWLSVLLAVCMLLSCLSGCFGGGTVITPTQTAPTVQTTEPEGSAQWEETTQPEETDSTKPALEYVLTEADVDEFYRLLDESEKLALESTDYETVDEITNTLGDQLYYLSDQSHIAYVLHCCDLTDEQASETYLSSVELVTQASDDYMEMVRRVYLSDAPTKEQMFAEWTEAEIAQMLAYDSKIMELSQRNAELQVAYRELDAESMAQDMIPLYNELVRNNNEIAKLNGYDNYYEYAYKVGYARDYGTEQVSQMRKLVAQYLAPVCADAYNGFAETFGALGTLDQMKISSIMYDDYDVAMGHPLEDYLASLPESMKNVMEGALTGEDVWFSKNVNALEGAFTTQFGDRSFCFFGPGYQNSMTVAHELGHYYGGQYTDTSEIPLDLAELQSQGNEWLMMAWLEGELDQEVYEALLAYKLYENLTTILICTIIDEFEQQVYTHPNAGNLTLAQYETLMEDICVNYGGVDYIGSCVTDVQAYWKLVVLESPVYYISYGVSLVSAMNLYTMGQTDLEKAQTVYMALIEELDCEKGFLENIAEAGLPGPFDSGVYEKLRENVQNNV